MASAERHYPKRTAFGVYVHWPFCLSKCPYCDFNSHVRHAPIDEERFARAFAREIETTAARAPGRTVTSIFLGGGTPSLMQPQTVGSILDSIGKHWRVADNVEVTLEANPTSVEATRFRGYRTAGVNRVSLGVQALDDASLKALGRLHSAREALDAVAIARTAFDRYSFDLIYARPDQTPQMWADELKLAISEAAEHLSLYQLTIEEGTPFFGLHAAGKLKTPDEAVARALYDVTQEVCAHHGLPAYEISNHARAGAECQHNLVYWRGDEYAGIGPGAHGRLDIDGTRHAIATEKRPEAWLMRVEANGHGVVTDDFLNSEERADEFLLMGLRLAEGIDPKRYAALSGRALDPSRIAVLREEGAIIVDADGRLRVTKDGFPVLDAVVADLAAYRLSFLRSRNPSPRPLAEGTRVDTCFQLQRRWLWARCVRRGDERSRPKALRRSRNRRAAAAGDLHHRKAALVGAVGAESKQAVDAGKARRVGQRFRRKTLRALLRQRGDERDRVIGQRCGAHGVGAVFGAVAAGEGAKARRIRRGIEPALQHGARIDARIVPQPGAEQLDVAQIRAGRSQGIRRRRRPIRRRRR